MVEKLDNLKQKIKNVLKKHNIAKAGIFGSYARGEQKKNSDVDILIEVSNDMGLIGFISLKMLIEKAIKKKIDLVEYDAIRKELKENILKEEIRIIWKEIISCILMI